ncbi:MAG: hypothetical protein EBT79_11745 [Actinobacteria bacterium]|nr:hypothetical protein [Actinomycetota bacterium]
MIGAILVAVLLSVPEIAQAAVIFSQTFESFADNDTCTQLVTGQITFCRGTGTVGANTNLITVENAVPGYASTFPSGSKVMRAHVNSVDAQGDAGILIGDPDSAGYDNWIPSVAWIQIAMWVNNAGGEVTSTTARPMKLLYPCRQSYPCQTNYFLIETVRSSSYAPFCDTSLSSDTSGNMYLAIRDSSTFVGQGTISYPSSCTGVADHLGQTSLADYIKPGRWNIIRVKVDFSDSASAKLDAWIGPMGGTLTQVMSWHGGTAVEGQSFSWTVPSVAGHRAMWVPSTQPANAVTGATDYFYFDDIYIATSEADLPTYGAGEAASPARFGLFNLRR